MWFIRQPRAFPLVLTNVRLIYKSHGPRPSGPSELEIHQKFQRISSAVIAVLGTVGLMSFYYKKHKKDQLLKDTVEIEKDHTNNLSLVSYHGCVLPADLITSGTMKKVSEFVARSSDVFVTSFPKSGTTWAQEVVYQLYSIACSKQRLGDIDNTTNSFNCEEVLSSADSTMETRFPYLEHIWPGIKAIEDKPGGRLIKSHLPVHLLPESVFYNGSKVIYIYRNPKDVVVSYYHFAKMLTFINYQGSFYEFLVQFMQSKVPYSPYFPHLFGYMDKSKTCSKLLIICYEDMKENPAVEIERIADFLGIPLQKHELDQVVQATTFEAMKQNPNTNYDHWIEVGLRNKNESAFMRKGEVGDYKNVIDEAFDELVNVWIKNTCDKLRREPFQFKYSLKPRDETSE